MAAYSSNLQNSPHLLSARESPSVEIHVLLFLRQSSVPQKEYAKEAELLRALVSQNVFRRGQKGKWYDRLALNLMRYPRGMELDEATSEVKKTRLANKRFNEALQVSVDGLEDLFTHLGEYHLQFISRILFHY